MVYNNAIPSSLRKQQAYANGKSESMVIRQSMLTEDTRSSVANTINKTMTFAASHGRESSYSSGKNESKNYGEEEFTAYKEHGSRSNAIEKRGSSGIDLPSDYGKNLKGGDSPTQTFFAEVESQKHSKWSQEEKSMQNEASEINKTSISDISREKNPTHTK